MKKNAPCLHDTLRTTVRCQAFRVSRHGGPSCWFAPCAFPSEDSVKGRQAIFTMPKAVRRLHHLRDSSSRALGGTEAAIVQIAVTQRVLLLIPAGFVRGGGIYLISEPSSGREFLPPPREFTSRAHRLSRRLRPRPHLLPFQCRRRLIIEKCGTSPGSSSPRRARSLAVKPRGCGCGSAAVVGGSFPEQ